MQICTEVDPLMAQTAAGHWVRCHLYPGSTPESVATTAQAVTASHAEEPGRAGTDARASTYA
jgi:hypothetical protein